MSVVLASWYRRVTLPPVIKLPLEMNTTTTKALDIPGGRCSILEYNTTGNILQHFGSQANTYESYGDFHE